MRGLAGAFATRINLIIVRTSGHRIMEYNPPENIQHKVEVWLIYLDLEHTRRYLSTTKILSTAPQIPPPAVSVANGNTARIRRVTGSTKMMHGMLRGREVSDGTLSDNRRKEEVERRQKEIRRQREEEARLWKEEEERRKEEEEEVKGESEGKMARLKNLEQFFPPKKTPAAPRDEGSILEFCQRHGLMHYIGRLLVSICLREREAASERERP